MREEELKLTAEPQPPEGVAAFYRLSVITKLLQLKVTHMKSADIYLSEGVICVVSHCDDVSAPTIKSKEVVG